MGGAATDGFSHAERCRHCRLLTKCRHEGMAGSILRFRRTSGRQQRCEVGPADEDAATILGGLGLSNHEPSAAGAQESIVFPDLALQFAIDSLKTYAPFHIGLP